mgnify:CR=1 FL=1
MFTSRAATLAGWAAFLALASAPAHAIVGSSADSLLSGAGVDYLNAVAKLTLTRSDGTYTCSGSLLASGLYVLTAAHCVTGADGDATTSKITLSWNEGEVKATSTSYIVATGWDGDLGEGNDLALIQLSSAVTGIDGYALYTGSALGEDVLIAGYGRTGTGSTGSTGDSGTLYYGYNEYDADGRVHQMTRVTDSIYLYDFDDGSRRTSLFGSSGLGSGLEALIAPGDSGGATLVYDGGVWYLAGVHSFIGCLSPNCAADSSFGDYAGDVSVYAQLDWLQGYVVSPVAAVPEPGNLTFFLAGLGTVLAASRAMLRSRSGPA